MASSDEGFDVVEALAAEREEREAHLAGLVDWPVDPAFKARLAETMEENRELLDRLAET